MRTAANIAVQMMVTLRDSKSIGFPFLLGRFKQTNSSTSSTQMSHLLRMAPKWTIVAKNSLPSGGYRVLAVLVARLHKARPQGCTQPLTTRAPSQQSGIATGFSGHGFQLAPVLGEISADMALTGATQHDVTFMAQSREQS